MKRNGKGCGDVVSMGQGPGAVCGDDFYGMPFICDACKIKTLKMENSAMKRNINIHTSVRDAEEFRAGRKPSYYQTKPDNSLQFVFVALGIMGAGLTICGLILNSHGLL